MMKRFLKWQPTSVDETVSLIERFIRDDFAHPYEWAEFLEWDNPNEEVEKIRQKVEKFTPILLSKKPDRLYLYKVELQKLLDTLTGAG